MGRFPSPPVWLGLNQGSTVLSIPCGITSPLEPLPPHCFIAIFYLPGQSPFQAGFPILLPHSGWHSSDQAMTWNSLSLCSWRTLEWFSNFLCMRHRKFLLVDFTSLYFHHISLNLLCVLSVKHPVCTVLFFHFSLCIFARLFVVFISV